MTDEPPLITIIVIIALILGFFIMGWIITHPRIKIDFDNLQPREENSIRQTNTHYYPEAEILASIITERPRTYLEEKIPLCESDGDPEVCNKEFGCIAGMGLWGFVATTWNETLDRMAKVEVYMPEECWEKIYLPATEKRIEAIFNAECNDIAGRWLLKADGTRHWGFEGADWGSWSCWK